MAPESVRSDSGETWVFKNPRKFLELECGFCPKLRWLRTVARVRAPQALARTCVERVHEPFFVRPTDICHQPDGSEIRTDGSRPRIVRELRPETGPAAEAAQVTGKSAVAGSRRIAAARRGAPMTSFSRRHDFPVHVRIAHRKR